MIAMNVAKIVLILSNDAYILRCALKYRSPLLSLDKGLLKTASKLLSGVTNDNIHGEVDSGFAQGKKLLKMSLKK